MWEPKQYFLPNHFRRRQGNTHFAAKEYDKAIEQYLHKSFGVNVDFDLEDALGRLLKDGVATEADDGAIQVLDPTAASAHIDNKWDSFLDDLPDYGEDDEGTEFEGLPGGAVAGPEAKPKEVDLDT